MSALGPNPISPRHLGKTEERLPYNRGFDRTLAMMDTGADNWEHRPYLPVYDDAIGRLLDYFEDTGEMNSTVVIFTSDNGPETLIVPDRLMACQGYRNE